MLGGICETAAEGKIGDTGVNLQNAGDAFPLPQPER